MKWNLHSVARRFTEMEGWAMPTGRPSEGLLTISLKNFSLEVRQ